MHRNTYLVVMMLAVVAALVVGVNIGKKLSLTAGQSKPTPTPVITPTPEITSKTFTDVACGFSLVYPGVFTMLESASGSAILMNPEDKNQAVALTCQKDIPRPPILPDQIETMFIPTAAGASVSAKLYHDASQKDGVLIDKLIFRHPKTGLDVFIAASPSATFRQILSSVTLLP